MTSVTRNIQGIGELISEFDENTNEVKGHRLITASNISPIMEHILDPNWQDDWPILLNGHQIKRVVNRVQPIYEYFLGQLKKKIKMTLIHHLNCRLKEVTRTVLTMRKQIELL